MAFGPQSNSKYLKCPQDSSRASSLHCILPAAFENWYISILQARINIEAKAQWELWGNGERFLIFVFAYAARQSIIHSIPSNICALRPGLRALFFCKRGVPPAPANFTAVIRSGF
ncbi:hypothetical protein B0H10DRAFT_1951224 [Mycena sp. CBHHK59/15]|nr:hypothetical protein B0H10DRAFT_1951224 [Mycena sp. CBHHK59/15]